MSLQSETTEVVETPAEEQKSIPTFYIKNDRDEWVANPDWDAWARSLYYNGRLCYENDNRFPVGRYDVDGKVILFQRHSTTDDVSVEA